MPSYSDSFTALIRGEHVEWRGVGLGLSQLTDICAAEGLTGLLYQHVKRLPADRAWPDVVIAALARAACAETAAEMVRGREIREALADLRAAGVRPILLKGTSLAYTVYEDPGSRPRGDTDILVREADVEPARRALTARGYRATIHCDDLFSQFEVQKTGELGVVHVFDVHWKISTQPIFENLFTYDELARDAAAVPALGPDAWTAAALHALLLACVHPVMHHQNTERLLWIYDVHLLASRLSLREWDAFAAMARGKAMSAVCLRELRLARQAFGTSIPESTSMALSNVGELEPSMAYLARDRRWHHELVSILRALPGWTPRARHLREVLFPAPEYVLGAYGLRQKPFGALLLPALYVHRNISGVWKILVGRK
jgi:hypothetical protein